MRHGDVRIGRKRIQGDQDVQFDDVSVERARIRSLVPVVGVKL